MSGGLLGAIIGVPLVCLFWLVGLLTDATGQTHHLTGAGAFWTIVICAFIGFTANHTTPPRS